MTGKGKSAGNPLDTADSRRQPRRDTESSEVDRRTTQEVPLELSIQLQQVLRDSARLDDTNPGFEGPIPSAFGESDDPDENYDPGIDGPTRFDAEAETGELLYDLAPESDEAAAIGAERAAREGPAQGSTFSDSDTGATEREKTDPTRDDVISKAPPAAQKNTDIQVGQCFARGGMAELYHARRRTAAGKMKRFVMKKLLRELQQDPTFVERFKHEARVTRGLDHPHIVRTFELGRHEGQYYIAMEYLPGRDLGDVLNRLHHFGVQCPVEIAVEIALAVARALEFVHDLKIADESGQRIVHRDVNPSNVMLTWQGSIKLLDFGLAKDPESDLTHGGQMVGKLMYQPPEALAQGAQPTVRFDVYAVGLLMYELLSGRAPFGGLMSSAQLMQRIQHEPLVDIRSLNDTVPAAVASIVHKAAAKDPDERFSAMGELVDALDEAMQVVIGGRGDVRRFMRLLYQDDSKVPQRVALSERATPDRRAPIVTPLAPLTPQQTSEAPRHWPILAFGLLGVAAVAALMYVLIQNSREEVEPIVLLETGIEIQCDPGGVVFLDSLRAGDCPTVRIPAAAGDHEIQLVEGKDTHKRPVSVAPGEVLLIDLTR